MAPNAESAMGSEPVEDEPMRVDSFRDDDIPAFSPPM